MTSDDKTALAQVSKAAQHAKKPAERGTWREIYQAGLRAWQRDLAEWCAVQAKEPPWRAQAAMASEIAGTKITYSMIRALWQKPEFRELVQRAMSTAQAEARVILENDMPFYMRKHREAMEKVLEEGQYAAVPKFTVPIVERVHPRGDHTSQNLMVNIVMTPRQLAREESAEIEVTATPIVPEPEPPA